MYDKELVREILAQIYFDMDAEAIFQVCKNHIPPLSDTLKRIIREL